MHSFAQTQLPAQCEVWLPKNLDKDVISRTQAYKVLRKPYGQSPSPKEKHYWVVFSDREDNVTYVSPKSGSAKYKMLEFNERLIIASIKNDYALVYREPKVEKYPLISSAAESMGWVPLSKLLLWNKGLADDADITYKAVICSNLNTSYDAGSSADAYMSLYHSPNGRPHDKLKADMHFYFIVKEEGSKALLSRYATLPTNSSIGLYGWVDVNSYVPWNQRTCLEPTWDRSNVEWFANNNRKWRVYWDQTMTGSPDAEQMFSVSKIRTKKDQYAGEYKYRTMPARRLRFPILEGSTKDLYHCSAFGTLSAQAENFDYDGEYAKLLEDLNKSSEIRIGVLIDGTSSMKNYFQSVKNAIQEGCKYFADNDKVQVAVAIYRNKADGQYVFESFPSVGGFTPSANQNLNKFLDSGGKYGVKSVGKQEQENLFDGILSAIQRFNFSPDQSNLLIVVGDCGDNTDDKTEKGRQAMLAKRSEIIDLLAKQKVSLMSFQVHNKQRDSYQSFNTNMTYIQVNSLQKRYDNTYYTDKITKKKVKLSANIIAKPMDDKTGWSIYNTNAATDSKSLENLFSYTHRRTSKFDTSVDPVELTKMIENTISEWNSRIIKAKEELVIVLEGHPVNTEGDGFLSREIKTRIGEDRFNKLVVFNDVASFRGWTYKRDPASKREFYKVVVFFPAPELRTLVEKLEPVYKASRMSSSDRLPREPYVVAMTQLASTLSASDPSLIKSTKYKAIIAKVFGVDGATTDLGGPSLADIADPNIVSEAEYRNIVNKMKNSYERLLRILGEEYPFIYETAGSGDKYYWLPSEYLPL